MQGVIAQGCHAQNRLLVELIHTSGLQVSEHRENLPTPPSRPVKRKVGGHFAVKWRTMCQLMCTDRRLGNVLKNRPSGFPVLHRSHFLRLETSEKEARVV